MSAGSGTILEPQGEAARSFLAFWRTRTDLAQRLPFRTEIQPDNLTGILDHIWLYERDGDDFRCVIMGNHVQVRWGKPVIGARFSDLMPKDRAETLVARLLTALENGYVGHGVTDVARSSWYAERVYGPLLNQDGVPSAILGVSNYVDRRLTVRPGKLEIPLGVTNFYDALSLSFESSETDAD